MPLSDWQGVPLVTTGDLWTAALHNTYIRANQQALYDGVADHEADTSNPHQVTPTQIGAATQSALDAHEADTNNPHQVTAAQVGAAPTIITGTGTCWRFPDGMQICWYTTASIAANSASTWTYPAAFSAAPTVVTVGQRTKMDLYSAPSATAVTFMNDGTNSSSAYAIAIGYWT